MRVLAAIVLLSNGCTGDIIPIAIPGPAFVTEAGNLPGPMRAVRGGFIGPIAAGGGTDPLLLERIDGGWIPRVIPDGVTGPIRDLTVVQGTLVATSEHRAVFARSPDDIFFAGDGIHHSDGIDQRRIDTSSAASESFHSLWGTDSTVVAVGDAGVALMLSGDSVKITDTGTTATLRSVHGRSRTEVYAVGGDDSGAVLRWDGERWSHFGLVYMPPLHAVFAGASGVWVCGEDGYLARWDGQRWIEIATGAGVALTGAYEQEGDLFVTGGNIRDTAASGFVARYGE